MVKKESLLGKGIKIGLVDRMPGPHDYLMQDVTLRLSPRIRDLAIGQVLHLNTSAQRDPAVTRRVCDCARTAAKYTEQSLPARRYKVGQRAGDVYILRLDDVLLFQNTTAAVDPGRPL